VTFLFTDVEGSTQRWRRDEDEMAAAMRRHDDVLTSVVADAGGRLFKHTGDGVVVAFASPSAGVAAAVQAQRQLELPVRMGLHTGEAELRDGDYFGTTLNRAARVMDAGHGGQILLSAATASLVADVETVDLGAYSLKGLDEPERIHQVGADRFAELRVHRDVLGNLPAELDAFIGREDDMAELAEVVGQNRIVTLIGVGGTGKTRLALHTAASLRWQFPDGCWLVDLAAINTADAVPFAVASGVGLEAPDSDDVIDHLAARIGRQRRLVIVDNCEHLLEAAGDAIEQLVAACPNVHVLATSREPVMVRGERLTAVASLSSTDAVALFFDRAAAEAPSLTFDEVQLAAAEELCERLDRLPLAIELAASRLRAQTPVELLSAIDERLRLLVGGRRSRMERHQTMRGALDWSYDLCDPIEQHVFDRLSVFPTGFDLHAAAAVASSDAIDEFEVHDAVARLVDRSLVARTQGPGGVSRFRLLETMRAYGREHLQHAGVADDVRERHARWTQTQVASLLPQWYGPDPATTEARLRALLPDAAVALDWCLDNRRWESASILALSIRNVEPRISAELVDRVWTHAEDLDELDALPAYLLATNVSQIMSRDGFIEQVKARALDDIRRGDWFRGEAGFLIPPHVGFINANPTPDEARELIDSLDQIPAGQTYAQFLARLLMAGAVASALGPIDSFLAEIEPYADRLDGPHARGRLHAVRGHVAADQRNYGEALPHLERAIELLPRGYSEAIGVRNVIVSARALIGLDIHGEHLREPWLIMRELGFHLQVNRAAWSTGLALVHLDRPDDALHFLGWLKNNPIWTSRYLELDRLREEAPWAAELYEAAEPVACSFDELADTALEIADELDRRR
jgi:predicted ATPase